MATFEQLVTEAQDAPFSGWDFSWLAARSTQEPLPWDYRSEVARRAAGAWPVTVRQRRFLVVAAKPTGRE